MDSVFLLSTHSFPNEWLSRLQSISTRLKVVQHRALKAEEVPADLWSRAEILYSGSAYPDPAYAPRLRWLQLDTAGANHLMPTPLWQSDVALTTLNGVAPPNMAEHAFMMILAFAHRLPQMLQFQAQVNWPSLQTRWDYFTPAELGGATIGVVGYGKIGKEIGRVAHAFGMRVFGFRRGASTKSETYQIPALANLPGTDPDKMYTPPQLHEMLAQCDYVVIIAPHTVETHHMIDARALQAMKPGAAVVNIARGGVVDEAALIEALRTKRIGGAALDVFEQEPLPPDNPLWKMENVIISPHVAGFTPHYLDRVFDLFSANLKRYLAGEPLLNLVDRARGY